jgi:hypothetical protein
LNFREERFYVTLTHGWVSTFLSRHSKNVGRAIISPQELPRLQTPRCYLDKYINPIKACIPLVPSELIFNLDESGLSDWEERKSRAVLVKAEAADQPLHYPVDCGIRHHTLLCCISASGDAYCPLLLSLSRAVLRIYEKGVRENIDLQIKIVDSLYVTREIFIEYVCSILIPTVKSNRLLPGCQNKPAILFCDNCASHCSDEVKWELAEHRILLITYPPHTSHIFQVIDTLLFGRLKAEKKCLLRNLNLGRDLDHVMRIFRAYELATTSLTVRSSWEKTGFGFEQRDGTWYLYVNETKVRSFPKFAEVWALNNPEESLSVRKRQQVWGWINQQFFRVKYRKSLRL